jgi:uncharacterized protein (DUF2267 family)
VVRAVASVFAERLPADERAQFEAHLPADVRQLTSPPRRLGPGVRRMRTAPELIAEVAVLAPEGMAPERRREVVEAVVHALRDLVPDEAADVAAVLPHDLRVLWETAPAG